MASVISQFLRNVALSYLGMIVGINIAFFFTPYLISTLGKTEYGLWTLIFSIISYMELADLGMRQSIVRNISKYFAKKDWHQVNEVFSSSVRIYFVIGLIIEAATLIIAFYLLDFFQIDESLLILARATLIVIGTDQALSFLMIPFFSLGPYHRFDIGTYFSIPVHILQTLGVVALLELGYGLLEMAWLVLVLSIASKYGMHLVRRKLFPKVRFALKYITWEKTRELTDYALYSFLIVIMFIVIYQTDNIVIGWFISMEAISVFSIGAALISQLRGIIYSISIPLVPTISHFDSEDDYKKINGIYSRSTKYLYFLSGFLAVCTFVFGGPFILLWVGFEFTESIRILHLLIIPAVIYFPQIISDSILLGISRHRITFYIMTLEASSNIILSIILVQFWGIIGVAIGTALPQFLIYTMIYPVVFSRSIKAKVKQFYLTASKSLLISILASAPIALLIVKFLEPGDWFNFFTGAIVTTLFATVCFYHFILEPDDKAMVITKMKKIFRNKT